MKVSTWGNSLAVRIPAALVDELGLHDGDEVELTALGPAKLAIAADTLREEALARIRAMRVPLPPGYKFDREEANARGPE